MRFTSMFPESMSRKERSLLGNQVGKISDVPWIISTDLGGYITHPTENNTSYTLYQQKQVLVI